MSTTRPLAVFDIDGVLADVSGRVHYLSTRPKDWRSFFAAAVHDAPLVVGFDLLARYAADHDIVFCTGRPESWRRDTINWLTAHGATVTALHMRRRGDTRRSAVTKLELLNEIAAAGHRIAVVVDDDPTVVAAYQAAGYPVLHATWAAEQEALAEAQQVDGRV